MDAKPVFKDGLKVLTHVDLGLTEDEFNNFLIDIWRPGGIYDQVTTPKSEIPTAASGETITITLNKNCYHKHN